MDKQDKITLVYLGSEITVGVVSLLTNLVVLLAILKTPSLHTVANVFIANLAIADMSVGLFVTPLTVFSWFGLPRDFYGCLLLHSLIIAFTNVSVLMLVAIAIERFVAIKEPFYYYHTMTMRRAYWLNSLVWILSFLLATVPLLWNTGYQEIHICSFLNVVTLEYMVYFQFLCIIVLPLIFITCIYVYLVVVVRQHTKSMGALHAQLEFNEESLRSRRTLRKDVRAAKMFAFVVFAFAILWLPLCILSALAYFWPKEFPLPYEVTLLTIMMTHLNSSVNPFLYALNNTQIRTAMKRTVGMDAPNIDSITPSAHSMSKYRSSTLLARHSTKEVISIQSQSSPRETSATNTTNDTGDWKFQNRQGAHAP